MTFSKILIYSQELFKLWYTNIISQTAILNNRIWKQFENYCAKLYQNKAIYDIGVTTQTIAVIVSNTQVVNSVCRDKKAYRYIKTQIQIINYM